MRDAPRLFLATTLRFSLRFSAATWPRRSYALSRGGLWTAIRSRNCVPSREKLRSVQYRAVNADKGRRVSRVQFRIVVPYGIINHELFDARGTEKLTRHTRFQSVSSVFKRTEWILKKRSPGSISRLSSTVWKIRGAHECLEI